MGVRALSDEYKLSAANIEKVARPSSMVCGLPKFETTDERVGVGSEADPSGRMREPSGIPSTQDDGVR
jgi:hypothetical protein